MELRRDGEAPGLSVRCQRVHKLQALLHTDQPKQAPLRSTERQESHRGVHDDRIDHPVLAAAPSNDAPAAGPNIPTPVRHLAEDEWDNEAIACAPDNDGCGVRPARTTAAMPRQRKEGQESNARDTCRSEDT